MTNVSSDRPVRVKPDLSPRRAAAMITLAWLPALIITASLPRFVPVYDRWRWELPPLTRALMPVGQLGTETLVLAGVGLIAILAGVGAGWVWAGLPGRRGVVFALAAAGLGAFVVGMVGALGPVIPAPQIGR